MMETLPFSVNPSGKQVTELCSEHISTEWRTRSHFQKQRPDSLRAPSNEIPRKSASKHRLVFIR